MSEVAKAAIAMGQSSQHGLAGAAAQTKGCLSIDRAIERVIRRHPGTNTAGILSAPNAIRRKSRYDENGKRSATFALGLSARTAAIACS